MQVSKPLKVHILGTDTDVGKTWSTHQLLKALKMRSITSCPVKPIHSGWDKEIDFWGQDLQVHGDFLNDLTPEQLTLYSFKAPMSPHAAAKLERKNITLNGLNNFWASLDDLNYQMALVEGIGGICCPLSENLTYLEFLEKNKAPCLLITKVGLGSLNQAIMSYRLLKSIGIEVIGVLLNPEKEFKKDDLIFKSAKWELESQINCPILGPLKRGHIHIQYEFQLIADDLIKRLK